MNVEDKLKWLDGLIVDLELSLGAYRHALQLMVTGNPPPDEVQRFCVQNFAELLSTAQFLESASVALRMARQKLTAAAPAARGLPS